MPKHPYELLFRYAPSGALQGAHIQWQHVDEAGTVIGITPAAPIAIGAQEGFPLADALDATTQAAVLQAAEVQTKADEADRLRALLREEEAKTAALEIDVASLRAALAQYT